MNEFSADGGRGELRQRRHPLFHFVEFGDGADGARLLPRLPERHDHLRQVPAHRRHLLPVAQAVLQGLHSRKSINSFELTLDE
jgi:hypothetical protein